MGEQHAIYRIRFHGRGGQGMKTASRILGNALFRAGFEVQDAPRYGAERRGAPIFAYVRASRGTVNERGVIRRPDLVVVADDTLVPIPAAGVLAGVDEHTVLLLSTALEESEWRHRLNLQGPLILLPTPVQAADRLTLRYLGAACAAAAARLCGVVGREHLNEALHEELEPLGPAAVEENLSLALDAYARMGPHEGCLRPGLAPAAEGYAPPDWVELGPEEASVAAPAIHAALTSELSRTGLWRTMRPVIDYARCGGCWWVCSTFCPDGAIRVATGGRPEIDYEHCKGCMVCVVQCPPHAIEAVPETLAAGKETP